ncbi:MAG TPA: hypothetical protein VK943_11575, partial [Arenibaculum sp.]|nr:hypothetical protein [Arenibaculum sp.]
LATDGTRVNMVLGAMVAVQSIARPPKSVWHPPGGRLMVNVLAIPTGSAHPRTAAPAGIQPHARH